MKKILILLSLFILGTVSVSYATEKDSKAQITFENEYIPSKVVAPDDQNKNQANIQKAGTLPQTNEHQNNWAIYGSLIFLGSLWLIKRRNNK